LTEPPRELKAYQPQSDRKGEQEKEAQPTPSAPSRAKEIIAPEKGKDVTKGQTTPFPLKLAIPRYKDNPRPVYPRLARRRGYEGTVVLEVLVNRKGRAEEVRLLKSSGHRILDRSAVDSVRKWLFEPAMRGDERIDTWVKVPIRFTLR